MISYSKMVTLPWRLYLKTLEYVKIYLTLYSIDLLMDSNKEDSDQLLKDGDIALEAALENTRVSQDLFDPVIN